MTSFLINKIRNNSYLLFLSKILILFASTFTLDYTIGKTLRYYYFKQESGMQYRTTFAMEKTTADVLIFGSSRANHHYHPEVFEKRLNLSFYNAGRDAGYIFYHYAVLKAVLKRYSPKIVILNFSGGDFIDNQVSYDRLAALLPYYETHSEIRSMIELKGPYEKLKLVSSIYPYNSSIFTIAVGNAEFNKKRRGDVKGYIPLTTVWDGAMRIENNVTTYKLDSTKIKIYQSFIEDCKNSNVKLYIFCSPILIKYSQTDNSILIAQDIAKNNNILFSNYLNDPLFMNNPKLFADETHLNDEGARVFSNMVVNDIQKTR
jgi:hypothetical protein